MGRVSLNVTIMMCDDVPLSMWIEQLALLIVLVIYWLLVPRLLFFFNEHCMVSQPISFLENLYCILLLFWGYFIYTDDKGVLYWIFEENARFHPEDFNMGPEKAVYSILWSRYNRTGQKLPYLQTHTLSYHSSWNRGFPVSHIFWRWKSRMKWDLVTLLL